MIGSAILFYTCAMIPCDVLLIALGVLLGHSEEVFNMRICVTSFANNIDSVYNCHFERY